MTDPEHAGKIIGNFILRTLTAVNRVDELVECVHNGVHVDFILIDNALGNFVSHVTIDVGGSRHEVLLDAGERSVLLDVEVDELIGNDAHPLEREGLNASAGEALHDPALALLFKALNLLLSELNDDIVIDHLEVVEALSDAGGVWTA